MDNHPSLIHTVPKQPKLQQHRLYSSEDSKMLHSAAETAKKIFAPASNSDDPGHATQYTKGALDRADLLPSPTD